MTSLPHTNDPAAIPRWTFEIELRIDGRARLVEGLDEARVCIEHGLYRPSYVSAWNGFVALALCLLSANDFAAVHGVRPLWKGNTVEDLARKTPGADLLSMLDQLELCTNRRKALLVLLLQNRNDCAHPTPFRPSAVEAGEYVSAVQYAGFKLIHRASQHPIG